MSHVFDFLHTDNHKSLLQIDTMILMGMIKLSQISQNTKFAVSLRCLKKEFRDEFDFWHADKHQSYLQVGFSTFAIKVSCKVILSLSLSFSRYSNKVASLQFICNIWKKKLGLEFITCMQINMKVPTSWYYRFWWKWPVMSKVPKIGTS